MNPTNPRRRGPVWRPEDILTASGDDIHVPLRRIDVVPVAMAIKEPYPGGFLSTPLSECGIEAETLAILARLGYRSVGDLRALAQSSILLFLGLPRLQRMRTAVRHTYRARHGRRRPRNMRVMAERARSGSVA